MRGARSVPTTDGETVEVERLWERRQIVELAGEPVSLPALDALILTRRIRSRPKDLEDGNHVDVVEIDH